MKDTGQEDENLQLTDEVNVVRSLLTEDQVAEALIGDKTSLYPIAMGEHVVDAVRYGSLDGPTPHSLLFEVTKKPPSAIMASINKYAKSKDEVIPAAFNTVFFNANDVLGLSLALATLPIDERREMIERLQTYPESARELSSQLRRRNYELEERIKLETEIKDSGFSDIEDSDAEKLFNGIEEVWRKHRTY